MNEYKTTFITKHRRKTWRDAYKRPLTRCLIRYSKFVASKNIQKWWRRRCRFDFSIMYVSSKSLNKFPLLYIKTKRAFTIWILHTTHATVFGTRLYVHSLSAKMFWRIWMHATHVKITYNNDHSLYLSNFNNETIKMC